MLHDSVALIGDLDSFYGDSIVSRLHAIAQRRPPLISVLIDSNGGDWQWGAAITTALDTIDIPTEGVVIGKAYSAAFTVLQHCGWRTAVPTATFMYHAPVIRVRIDDLFFEPLVDVTSSVHRAELERLAKRAGTPIGHLHRWCQDEQRFDAYEALRHGFIDSISYRVLGL